MIEPTTEVPEALRHLQRTNKDNIQDSKFGIAYVGTEKVGKTHCALSFPQPIQIAQADTNMATTDGFIKEGYDITVWRMNSWGKDFEDGFLVAAKNRQFPSGTLVVDSWSQLANLLVQEYPNLVDPDANTRPTWGMVRARQLKACQDILSCTSPIEGKPSYHVVVLSHLDEVTKDTKDSRGNTTTQIVGYRPAVPGSFKQIFGRMPGSTFLLESGVKRGEGNKIVGSEFFGYSVPPSNLYSIGDGIGGKGGYATLPARIPDPTYQGLCKSWGVEPEQPSGKPSEG